MRVRIVAAGKQAADEEPARHKRERSPLTGGRQAAGSGVQFHGHFFPITMPIPGDRYPAVDRADAVE